MDTVSRLRKIAKDIKKLGGPYAATDPAEVEGMVQMLADALSEALNTIAADIENSETT